jgi:nitroreductase
MDLFDAINQRRSVRKYRPDPVPREVLKKIVAAGIEAPSGCNRQLRHYIIVDDPKIMDALRPFSGAFDNAPAAIVVVMDPQGTPYGDFWKQDASAAIENMLLTTVAEGYAACWIEGALRNSEEELRKILNVPEALRVWAILPIGVAEGNPPRPEKKSFEESVFYNQYTG